MELIKRLNEQVSLLLVAIILIASLALVQTGKDLVTSIGNLFGSHTVTRFDRGSIVMQIRDASELTSSIFETETVVPISQLREWGRLKVGETKLLYVAKGEIRAGVNLSKLETKDVDIVNGKIHLMLPAPEILSKSLNVEDSGTFDIRRSPLGPRSIDTLIKEAEETALARMVTAACEKDILKEASNRASAVVTQVLSQAEYKDIQIDVRKPEANSCPVSSTSI